ncbi:MAG: hypothetical protein SGJ02_13845 [bacterium]|nr:hypothetical protein [bacterium]
MGLTIIKGFVETTVGTTGSSKMSMTELNSNTGKEIQGFSRNLEATYLSIKSSRNEKSEQRIRTHSEASDLAKSSYEKILGTQDSESLKVHSGLEDGDNAQYFLQ